MALKLYYAPMSSASPLMWALAELDRDHELECIDLKSDTHKQPDFLALNPMGQVPTLVDDGHAMFESSACIAYLGTRYGVELDLWPSHESPEHMVALTWLNWAAVNVGAAVRLMFASGEHAPESMRNEALYAHAIERLTELLHVFEGHMRNREFVAGAFCLTDCFVASMLRWITHVAGIDLDAMPSVHAYLDRAIARPAAAHMQ